MEVCEYSSSHGLMILYILKLRGIAVITATMNTEVILNNSLPSKASTVANVCKRKITENSKR